MGGYTSKCEKMSKSLHPVFLGTLKGYSNSFNRKKQFLASMKNTVTTRANILFILLSAHVSTSVKYEKTVKNNSNKY
jgi:hypothetical protein